MTCRIITVDITFFKRCEFRHPASVDEAQLICCIAAQTIKSSIVGIAGSLSACGKCEQNCIPVCVRRLHTTKRKSSSLMIVNCRSSSFVCRNVNAWISLPELVPHCKTTATFKRRLSTVDLTQFVNF